MSSRKEWMLGIPGHNELVKLDDVLLLLRGGQLRPTDLVKKLGEPWRAANEVTELAPHFSDAPAALRPPAEPIPLKPSETAKGPEPAARPVQDRGVRPSSKPPESTRSIPKIDPKPAETPKAPEAPKAAEAPRPAEDKAPIRTTTGRVAPASSAPVREEPKPETKKLPAVQPKEDREEKKEEKKADLKAPASARSTRPPDDKTDRISARSQRRRDLPKPPPRPVLKIEPMVGKYYSPVDMLRSASLAFEPKKLLYCLPVVVIMTLWSIGMHRSGAEGETGNGAFEAALYVLFTAILVFGLAFLLTGLAFVTRRQLEGRDYYLGEAVHYTVQSAITALAYPVLALVPSLLSLGILFLLRLARNRSPGMASTLKVAYLIPMIFAFIAVLGALVYQVASMYVPAAGAVEGEGLGASVRHAWGHVRRQWGRVVLHWLIVTVAFGVITGVCLGLSEMAIRLPDWIFKDPDDVSIRDAWRQFEGLQAIYRGIAYGLGMMLPVSLFSTFGMLSYLSLRHPAGAQLSPTPLDDTSGIAIGAMRGSKSPMESTNPSDTRPAPPDASPSYSDISDDSDEQPLVKD